MRVRAENAALLLGVFLLLDFGLAHVYNRLDALRRPPQPERPYQTRSPHYHHDLVKNVDVHAYWGPLRYAFRTNSLGFRDERVRQVPLRSEATRVLLLGDSFTEGVGVPFEETFAGILARQLRPRGIEVLNAGVVSYSPAIYDQKARYLIERLGLEVDLLVALIDVSDVLDEAWLDREGRPRVAAGETAPPPEPLRSERIGRALRKHSLTVKVAIRLWAALVSGPSARERSRLGVDAEEAAWDYDDEAYREYGARGLRKAAENMDRLLALARRHDIPLVVVVYPWPDQIFRRRLDSLQATFWRTWANRRGVDFINLFPRFITSADPRETISANYIPGDFHWGAAGHRLVAEALLEDGLLAAISKVRQRSAEDAPARAATVGGGDQRRR